MAYLLMRSGCNTLQETMIERESDRKLCIDTHSTGQGHI